jgi:hypothetical protein
MVINYQKRGFLTDKEEQEDSQKDTVMINLEKNEQSNLEEKFEEKEIVQEKQIEIPTK